MVSFSISSFWTEFDCRSFVFSVSLATSTLATVLSRMSSLSSELLITWRDAVESSRNLPPLTESAARSADLTSPLTMSSVKTVFVPGSAMAVPVNARNTAI